MPDAPSLASSERRRFLFAGAAVFLLALLLREYFLLVVEIGVPIKGDVRDYVAYARNLLDHGTFSMSTPPVPDAFRGPGYPAFLALASLLAGESWYAFVLHAQAMLGALTTVLTMAIARTWLPLGYACVVGTLLALWPHHVVATTSLLSEVLLGFGIVLGLCCSLRAINARGVAWSITGGLVLGGTWLVSPVVALLPLLAALVLLRAGRRGSAAWLLVCAMLVMGAWSLRNALVVPPDDAPGRAQMNFVQGSWPQYHQAAATAHEDPMSRQIMSAIDSEYRLLHDDPMAGLASIAARIRAEPAYYARWYFIAKPYLLWEWNIRAGIGGIYFHAPLHSPFETHWALRGVVRALRAANPVLFLLAAGFALLSIGRWRRARNIEALAPLLIALTFTYFTALHWVFQAEPRYAIPYRSIELLLGVGALAGIFAAIRTRGTRVGQPTVALSAGV